MLTEFVGRVRRFALSLKSPRRALLAGAGAAVVMITVATVAIVVPIIQNRVPVSAPVPTPIPSPEPTYDPTVSQVDCASAPSRCGFPDATTTGVEPGGLIKVPADKKAGLGWEYDERGWVSVTEDSTVIEDLDLDVPLDITADDVTVKNVRVTMSGDSWAIALRHVKNVHISNVTIRAGSGGGRLMVGIKDIYGDSTGTEIRSSDISGTSTGIQLVAGLIEGNYIHDLGYRDGDHVNGIASNGAATPLVIRNNSIMNPHPQTDAIGLFQDFGVEANRTVERNLLAGGGYTIYAGQNPGAPETSHIVIKDNRFAATYYPESGHYGYATAFGRSGPDNKWEGNVWDHSGARIAAP